MVTIMIADDHQMFIDGIKLILEKEPSICIIGEALNGKYLLDLMVEKNPDIILMDINMPIINGIEATRIIKSKYPKVKVLMLTMYSTKQYIMSMLAAGTDGYILKNTGKDELLKAIETLQRGETYYSQEVTTKIIDSLRKKDVLVNTNPELTPREKEILKLLAENLDAYEVGKRLNISHHTVKAHRKNMLSKFNVHSTMSLVKLAIERGLLD
jgi:DNA-binding NarL/FixJ family response regulator